MSPLPPPSPAHRFPVGLLLLCLFLGACTDAPPATEDCSTAPGQQCVQTPPPKTDDHGDTPAAAPPLAANGGAGVLDSPDDVDVFSFPVVAGHGYTVKVGFASAFFDSPVSGLYSYALTDRGVDDHGDEPAQATQLLTGSSVEARNDFHGDVDVFRFTAPAKQGLRVRCTSPGRAVSLLLEDSTGRILAHGDFGGDLESLTYEGGDTDAVLFMKVDFHSEVVSSCRLEAL